MLPVLVLVTVVASFYTAICFPISRQQHSPQFFEEYENYRLLIQDDESDDSSILSDTRPLGTSSFDAVTKINDLLDLKEPRSFSKEAMVVQVHEGDDLNFSDDSDQEINLKADKSENLENKNLNFNDYADQEIYYNIDNSQILDYDEDHFLNSNDKIDITNFDPKREVLDTFGTKEYDYGVRLKRRNVDNAKNPLLFLNESFTTIKIPVFESSNASTFLRDKHVFNEEENQGSVAEEVTRNSNSIRIDNNKHEKIYINKPFQTPELEAANDRSLFNGVLENQVKVIKEMGMKDGVIDEITTDSNNTKMDNSEHHKINIHKPLEFPELLAANDRSLLKATVEDHVKVFKEGNMEDRVVEEVLINSKSIKMGDNKHDKIGIHKTFKIPELETANDRSLLNAVEENQVNVFREGSMKDGTVEEITIDSNSIKMDNNKHEKIGIHKPFQIPELEAANYVVKNQEKVYEEEYMEDGVVEEVTIDSKTIKLDNNNCEKIDIHKPFQIPELEAVNDRSLLNAAAEHQIKVFKGEERQGSVAEVITSGSNIKMANNKQEKIDTHKPFQIPEMSAANGRSLLNDVVEIRVKVFKRRDSQGSVAEEGTINSNIIKTENNKHETLDIQKLLQFPELEATNYRSLLNAVMKKQVKVFKERNREDGNSEEIKIASYVMEAKSKTRPKEEMRKPLETPELKATNEKSSLLAVFESQFKVLDEGDRGGGTKSEVAKKDSNVIKMDSNNKEFYDTLKLYGIPELENVHNSLINQNIHSENENKAKREIHRGIEGEHSRTKAGIKIQSSKKTLESFEIPELVKTELALSNSSFEELIENGGTNKNKVTSEDGMKVTRQMKKRNFKDLHKYDKTTHSENLKKKKINHNYLANDTELARLLTAVTISSGSAQARTGTKRISRLKRAKDLCEECPKDDLEAEQFRRMKLSLKPIHCFWHLFPALASVKENDTAVETVPLLASAEEKTTTVVTVPSLESVEEKNTAVVTNSTPASIKETVTTVVTVPSLSPVEENITTAITISNFNEQTEP